MNDTAKTSGSQDLVKIRPAVAEQSRLHRTATKIYDVGFVYSERRRLLYTICLLKINHMLVLERVVQHTQSQSFYTCVISIGKQV